MPQGLIQPNNAILYAGEPVYGEYEVETVTTVAPGRLLITGTAEYQAKVATAASLGVIGVADVMADKKLTLMQTEIATGVPLTTYAVKDQLRVIRGDVVVKLLLKSGETVTVGERVEAAANGMCQAYTTALADVGYSLQNSTAPATVCEWILVKLTI